MNKLNSLLLTASIIAVFAAPTLANPVDTMAVVKGVTAHRGNSIAYPENTLLSLQQGINAHADWLEMDIRKTKDGQIVISHDASTKRTSGIDKVIANVTYDELKNLDVATDFRTRNNLTIQQCPPQHMPLLKDALALVMKQKRTKVSMHLKVDIAADAIEIIKSLHAEKMVGFNHSGLDFVKHAKQIAPQIPVFWDRLPDADIDADIKVAKQLGFEALVMNYTTITQAKVDKIKAAGLISGAWTIDDRATLEKLVKMGVERIYTNDPGLLIKIKREQKN